MTALTNEQKTTLNNEIANDPKSKGYADMLANGRVGHIVESLNALTETKYKGRMITARGILSGYAEGPEAAALVLNKLKAAAPSIPALDWVVVFLQQEGGLDIGEPATHLMLDKLVLGSIITSEEASNLKALSLLPASRAEVLDLPQMTVELFLSRNQ
jgi:hypothetical protein